MKAHNSLKIRNFADVEKIVCRIVGRFFQKKSNKIMQQKESNQNRRVVTIRVVPYLAQYARCRFEIHPKTGGIKIPDNYDLYHAVWHAMQKWPLERWAVGVRRPVDAPEGNLKIHLPNYQEGGFRKNPLYWNYISPRRARVIGRELKRLFDWEFHHYVEVMLDYHPGMTKKEAVARFVRKYGLGIDTEETLLKNYQRHQRAENILLELNKPKTRKNNVKTTCV